MSATLPTVLSMGFSPASALTTWRLSLSKMFQCYTYWPATKVNIQSEVFGSNMETFHPTAFDPADSNQVAALPSKSFSVVILVVPTIKDVVRMCRKLQPVISKNTLVLVDVSGGIAPLQRLVKKNLGSSSQVCGMICEIDAEFTPESSGSEWTIVHRKPQGNSVAKNIGSGASASPITLEPSSSLSKVLSQLETAWSASGFQASHTKTSSAFGELQWQKTIGAVAFEVLTVALDTPEPEALADSLIAKPIIEGLVGELSMVAAASGIKGLPSKSQLVKKGPSLARRAPPSFQNPRASRVYYDIFRKSHVSLDFLVLLPILLSDELPKGGATPYLESLYAYMNRIADLNAGNYESALFQRVGPEGASSSSTTTQIDPIVLANLEARSSSLDTRENELQARENRYQQVLEELRVQQQQHSERVAQFDNQWAQNERRLQSFEELNARSEQLRLREEQLNELERKAGYRERNFKQKEIELTNREQALMARESTSGGDSNAPTAVSTGGMATAIAEAPNGMHNGLPNGTTSSTPPQLSPQIPMTPGGTIYSRFDPKAPPIPAPAFQPQPQQQQQQAPPPSAQQQQQQQQSAYAPQPQMPYAQNGGGAPRMGVPFYGAPPSSAASIASARPRHSVSGSGPVLSPSSSRAQMMSPQAMQMQFYGGGQQPQMMAPQGAPGGRGGRRQQPRRVSMPNGSYAGNTQSQLFSQNFQLDGVMGSATDRYHFVSRARTKQKDVKLSSDEEAYSASRKFIHGSPIHSSTSQANSMNTTLDSQGGAYPGDISSRSFHPGDLSSHSLPSSRRSVSNIAGGSHANGSAMGIDPRQQSQPQSQSQPQQQPPQPLIPQNIVAGGPDFTGFSFGDDFDTNGVAAGTSSGSTGSQPYSTGSNGTPSRSRSETGTPPTPQGTIDPTVLTQGPKWTSSAPQVLPFDV